MMSEGQHRETQKAQSLCHLENIPWRSYKQIISKDPTHLICWQQWEVIWWVRYNVPLRWRITGGTCVPKPKPIYGTHHKYELTKIARKQLSHSMKPEKSNMQHACNITIWKLYNNCRRTVIHSTVLCSCIFYYCYNTKHDHTLKEFNIKEAVVII